VVCGRRPERSSQRLVALRATERTRIANERTLFHEFFEAVQILVNLMLRIGEDLRDGIAEGTCWRLVLQRHLHLGACAEGLEIDTPCRLRRAAFDRAPADCLVWLVERDFGVPFRRRAE